MRIAVDARSIYQEPSLRGIGKSTTLLYAALSAARPDWQFDLYFQVANGNPNPLTASPNVRPVPLDGPGDRFNGWPHFWLPYPAWRSGAAILHAPGNTGPPISVTPFVLTLHDLIPLRQRRGEPGVAAWGRAVRRAARAARRVLVPSRYVADDLHRTMGIAHRKIEVIAWGPSLAVAPTLDFSPPGVGPYLLHLGMTLARKNTRNVLHAWANVAPRHPEASLVIVGLDPQGESQFGQLAQSLGIALQTRLGGYINDQELSHLYRHASGFLYVSLDEGFGLPTLDAFAHGTPLIVSRVSCLPEIVGSAGLSVDPNSLPEIATAMEQLLTRPALQAELRARGYERLEQYSWPRCAETVAQIFASISQ